MKKSAIPIIIGIVFIALGIILFAGPRKEVQPPLSDFVNYQSEKFGFEFEYPRSVEIKPVGTIGTSWEIDTGSGRVFAGLVSKNNIGFNTKVGNYRYAADANEWVNVEDSKTEDLCRLQKELGKDTFAYEYDSNQMPNAYPRAYYAITNKDYAFNIFAVCGDDGCDTGELDKQNNIIKSFTVTGEVKSLGCNK